MLLRRSLWKNNLKGYRVNYKKVPGSPDVAFSVNMIAIFVNGCFWHRCPTCNNVLPKNNTAFWELKFKKNIARDVQKKQQLENLGWNVMVFWECQIKKEMDKVITLIQKSLK